MDSSGGTVGEVTAGVGVTRLGPYETINGGPGRWDCEVVEFGCGNVVGTGRRGRTGVGVGASVGAGTVYCS